MNTINTGLSKLRIHIAPVGFEVDRIVLPAKKYKADKVFLIKESDPLKEKAEKFIKLIQNDLKKNNIEVELRGCDRDDLFDIIKTVKTIFVEEESNDLYVNVSSGSKIQGIACMMSCMMFKNFDPAPYYVVPKEYHTKNDLSQSRGMKKIIDLPKSEIQIPSPKLIAALKIINDYKNEKITKKELASLVDNKLIQVNAQEKSRDKVLYGMLDKHIIQDLEKKWHYIKVEKIGRNFWVSLTDEGKDAIKYLI